VLKFGLVGQIGSFRMQKCRYFCIPKQALSDPKQFRDEKALIGSGPYKLKQYNQSDGSYLYEANKDFYLGEPAVKRLEFVPVKDEVLALQQGQIGAGSADVTVAGVGDGAENEHD
jgi:ABC-type transport system substrate-binding protein